METPHFDEYDRRKVISGVESKFQVKLFPIGRRRKYLRDETDRRYCLLGGCGDWHGIPNEIVRSEENNSDDSVLVIAKKYMTSIDIYCGSLRKLINNKSLLTVTKDKQYTFNIQIQGSRLFIKEISGMVLIKLGETPYSETQKENDKVVDEIIEFLQRLSPEQKKQVRKELLSDTNPDFLKMRKT